MEQENYTWKPDHQPLEQNAAALREQINNVDAGGERSGIWVTTSRGTGRGWSNYSSLEKTLWMSLAVVTLIVIGLLAAVIVLGVKLENTEKIPVTTQLTTIHMPWITSPEPTTVAPTTTTLPPGHNQCLSIECVLAASKMRTSIDMSVDPCENFYDYACGNWVLGNQIPSANNRWDEAAVLEEKVVSEIYDILMTEIPANETEFFPKSFLLAREFFNTCLTQDLRKADKSELVDLASTLTEGLKTNLTHLAETLGRIRHEIGGNYLFTLFVDLDGEDSTNNIIYFDQPELGLAKELLLGNDSFFRDAYRDLIVNVWMNLTGDERNVTEKVAETTMKIEIDLANISTKEEDRRNLAYMYNYVGLELLMNLTAPINFNWTNYLEQVFSTLNITTEDDFQNMYPLDFETMLFTIRDPQFFNSLTAVIEKYEPLDLANFLQWRIFLDFGMEVNSDIRNIFFEHHKITQELLLPPPLWKTCAKKTNELFGMAISYRYVEEHFDEETIDKGVEIIEAIRTAFGQTLNSWDWIDEDTKGNLTHKLETLKYHVGFPLWLQNQTVLDEYYSALELPVQSNYFKKYLHVTKWHILGELAEISYEKKMDTWLIDPTRVGSIYSPNYNSMIFPAVILQNPFLTMPLQALNYGAFGGIVGHEMIQGFTDTGIQMDAYGNFVGLAWATNDTTFDTYAEKTTCFAQQYGNYSFETEEMNLPLNGKTTVGMNIADNGGLRQAFYAYQSNGGAEQWLPGMTEFSPEQLFFLSYAQTFCGSYTTSTLKQLISTGMETPNKFRVQGALANSVEFANAWQCTVPDPTKMCQIW